MNKIVMYDADGFYVINCQLVGMNECGEPQLVVMTPGLPVTSLEAFMDEVEIKKMNLLCEEGQKVSSSRIVRVLSPDIKYMDELLFAELLDDMKNLGVSWSNDPVKMTVTPYKSDDPDEDTPYTLLVLLHDHERSIRFENYFESLEEILECLNIFHLALKEKGGIEVKMKLCFSHHYKPEVPAAFKEMFEEIHYPYEK